MIRLYTTGPIGPGFYDMPAEEYHADPAPQPSLSSSLGKVILSGSPRHAWALHPRLNPEYESSAGTRAMKIGTVAHELVLGKGGGFEVLGFTNYTTKAAREARDAAIEAGKTPILEADFEAALEMEGALRARLSQIEGAEHAFHPDKGRAETVAIAQDATGAWLRCMMDWQSSDMLEIWDYKTTSISQGGLSRHAIGLDYDLSAAHYERVVTQLRPELVGRIRFFWVFQEVEAPFEVTVFERDEITADMGRRKAAYAIDLWQRCMERGMWPGYSRKIQRLDYPSFAMKSWLDREMSMEGVDPLMDYAPWWPPVESSAPPLDPNILAG